MVRFACILLGAAAGGVADAFRTPSLLFTNPQRHAVIDYDAPRNLVSSSPALFNSNRLARIGPLLSKSGDGDDAALVAEDMAALDTDLAQEIEEALNLAQDALATESEASSDEEDEIDRIADMLLESPPMEPEPVPLPPQEEPPVSVISETLEEDADADAEGEPVGVQQPLPPEDVPPVVNFFAEALATKAAEELVKLKSMLPMFQGGLKEVQESVAKEEEAAAVLKKEIEESIKEREELVKRIEEEFASENEQLVAQMEIASDELQVGKDQSEQQITYAKAKTAEAEKGLLSRIESFKEAIGKVTSETIDTNKDTERIEQSKQAKLAKVVQEGKNKLAQFTKAFEIDMDYVKQVNTDLTRRAEEAEGMVKDVFDEMNTLRTERVSLQKQLVDVEWNMMEEIENLERKLEEDDDKYAALLQKERERLEEVIDVAYKSYAIKVCKKISSRQAVEAEYKDTVRLFNKEISAARGKQDARVKEYLDKLEGKHKKERIAVYQEKVEAIAAIRRVMNAELAIEDLKIEEIHQTMKPKLEAMQQQAAAVKAEFEEEMAKKREIADEEEGEILRQIEDVRGDMTDKIKTQRRLYEAKKSAYLDDMNAQISDSDVELRGAWRDLAGIKKSYVEVGAKRDNAIDDNVEKQALIDAYESDRESFRESLRLTAKVAKEKIGSKTRRLLGREKKKAP